MNQNNCKLEPTGVTKQCQKKKKTKLEAIAGGTTAETTTLGAKGGDIQTATSLIDFCKFFHSNV